MRLLLRLILNRYVLSILVLLVLLFDYKVISLYQSKFSIITFDEPPMVDVYAYYELPLDVIGVNWIEVRIDQGFIYHKSVEATAVNQTLIANPIISPLSYLIAFLVAWFFPFKWFINLGKSNKKKQLKTEKK